MSSIADAVRAEGPDASVDDLARVAGVPKSVLYNHFADRDGLMAAVAEAAAGEWYDRRLLGSPEGREPVDGRAAVEAFVDFAETEPQLYHLLRSASGGRRSADRFVAIGARIVAAVAPDRPTAGPVIAAAVAGAMFSAVDRWLLQGTTDRDDLIEGLLAFLQVGLLRPPDPHTP